MKAVKVVKKDDIGDLKQVNTAIIHSEKSLEGQYQKFRHSTMKHLENVLSRLEEVEKRPVCKCAGIEN